MSGSGAEIAALGLGIGLMFSLVCYLLTNLSPGGMITPGWLALAMVATPERVIIIAVVTAVTAGLTLVLRKYVILYGKRLFASVVMVGIFVQMTLVVLLANAMPGLTSGETIGFIIPGLMAYQLVRQPTGATLLAIGAVSSMAYGVIITGVLLGLVEESSRGFTSGISDGPLGLGVLGLVVVLGVIGVFTGALVASLGRIRKRAAAPAPIAPSRGTDPVLVAAGAAAAASAGHAGPVPPSVPVAPVVARPPREERSVPRPPEEPVPPLFGQLDEPAVDEPDGDAPAGDAPVEHGETGAALGDDELVVTTPEIPEPPAPDEPHPFVVRARVSAYASAFLPAAEAERLAQDVGILPGTQAEKFAIAVEHVRQRRHPTALLNAAALVKHGLLPIPDAARMAGADIEALQRHLLGGL